MSADNKLFLVQEHYFAADCEVTDTDKGHDNIHTVYTTGTVVLFVCSLSVKCWNQELNLRKLFWKVKDKEHPELTMQLFMAQFFWQQPGLEDLVEVIELILTV